MPIKTPAKLTLQDFPTNNSSFAVQIREEIKIVRSARTGKHLGPFLSALINRFLYMLMVLVVQILTFSVQSPCNKPAACGVSPWKRMIYSLCV